MLMTVGLPCRRAGRVILRFGGGICSSIGFFLKLNRILFETQLAAFRPHRGLRVCPSAWGSRCPSPRSGLRAAPLLHLRCPLWGFALAPLLVPPSSNHGAKIGRIFIASKFFAVIRVKNGCDKERFRADPRCRPLKRV